MSSVVESLVRMTASVDSLVAEYLVGHPSATPGTVSVLALLEWNAERLRAAGVEPQSIPARLWQALGGPRAAPKAIDDGHLETIRDLAAAPDRAEAEVDEITLRAALAETVAEIDRLRALAPKASPAAPPAGGFELRGFSPTEGGAWERIAHAFDDEPTYDELDDQKGDEGGSRQWARAAGPVEIELARRIGRYRRARGHDYLWVEPLLDGRSISLLPWGAGGAQLSIGRLGSGFHDDTWVYTAELAARAWRAALTWNGEGEPEGWYRHPASGRRREGGDPAKETTR